MIESHGGTVEKFIGDAVVGVFGVPAAHEDDPERAVRAGLRLVEALEGMTRPTARRSRPASASTPVRPRAPRRRPRLGGGFLTGDAVNAAARLAGGRAADGVVVGELTHALTDKVSSTSELPPVAAKGKRSRSPPGLRQAPSRGPAPTRSSAA